MIVSSIKIIQEDFNIKTINPLVAIPEIKMYLRIYFIK